jgi:hypothetical protein
VSAEGRTGRGASDSRRDFSFSAAGGLRLSPAIGLPSPGKSG